MVKYQTEIGGLTFYITFLNCNGTVIVVIFGQQLYNPCLLFVCRSLNVRNSRPVVSVCNVTYPHDIDLYSSEPLSPNSILESIWNPEFIFCKYRSKLFKKWLQCVWFIVWTICLLHVILVTKRFFKMYFCFELVNIGFIIWLKTWGERLRAGTTLRGNNLKIE